MIRLPPLSTLFPYTTLVRSAVAWVFFAGSCTSLVQAKSSPDAVVSAPIAVQDLPKEGQETYSLIRQGGPFRYEKDGVVFGNREKQLPVEIGRAHV